MQAFGPGRGSRQVRDDRSPTLIPGPTAAGSWKGHLTARPREDSVSDASTMGLVRSRGARPGCIDTVEGRPRVAGPE
jgi:hypothetical protein